EQQMQRRLRALAGEIPQCDIDGRERGRTDASRRQRMNALAQTANETDDGPAVLAAKLLDETIAEQRRNRRPAGADRVAEADPMAAGAIDDVDDRQLQRVELLDRVAAGRIDRHAAEPHADVFDREPAHVPFRSVTV